ncbi:MAG: hypothetical protein WD942_04660 [Dehalococcoidia bacterium]
MARSARATFIAQLEAHTHAVQGNHLLKASPPDQTMDEAARLARNGLAVVGFAVLEDFVRHRCRELVAHMSLGPAAFAELPDALRSAVSEGVVSTLLAQVRQLRRSDEDPLELIQDTGRALASTKTGALEISPLALLWDGSNLNSSDLQAILKALGVKDAWRKMSALCQSAGFAVLDARAAFDELARNRHRSAHLADHDATVLSIRSLPRVALAVGFAFDALASKAAHHCHLASHDYLLEGYDLVADDVPLRFLDDRGTDWAEVRQGRKRAYRIHATRGVGRAEAIKRCIDAGETLVVRDRSGHPTDWIPGDLP